MANKKITYHIRKTFRRDNYSVMLNNSLGAVLEIKSIEEATKMCEILNSNSDSNCRYEIYPVSDRS